MEIIDFHTHPWLNQQENACIYKKEFALSSSDGLKDLKNAGITHICGSVISQEPYDRKKGFAQLRQLNEDALKLQAIYGDYYTPGFHIHPAFIRESLEEMERMHKLGVRLIGELVPYMHGWAEWGLDYASRELWELLELAGEYGMTVSFHTMPEQQEQMNRMIAQNKRVNFVAAHPGQAEDYRLQLERLQRYENAYLDLSGTGLFRYGMLRTGIRRAGADRILFGTDYPIVNPGMYIQAVKGEHITEDEREKIFFRNARRLLGMNG